MRNNEKLHSAALASIALILFLILVSSVASASITETQITNHGTAGSPAIYGNTVVWQDTRNVNYEIYALDLSNKKETHINASGSAESPSIYGNKLVYHSNDGYLGNTYMCDLATEKQIMINSYPDFAIGKPVVYGNLIVWEDKRNGRDTDQDWARNPGDIYMYDITTKKETKIDWGSSPSIYDKKIVWYKYDFISNIGNIYMYDLSTQKITQISHSGSAYFPNIYGNKIVWEDGRNGNSDIYMYDLPTKRETQITSNTSDQRYPAIYGNNIVWEDGRSGNSDIYAYDLITHQQIHTTDTSAQVKPAIYSNKIVWIDYRNEQDKPDIYMGTISFLPVAAFSASPTTGTPPLNVQFTDQSTDVYNWKWDFGDGTTSSEQNPLHTYSKAGNYTVSLTVSNAAGNNTEKKKGYITVNSGSSNPVAAFSASPTSGNAPLDVSFTDTSTGSPTSWNWNFGDGSISTEQNPKYTYSTVGSYIVTLVVNNEKGTSSSTSTINVLEQSSSSGGSDNGGGSSGGSSSSSSSGGGGGGGAGGSPESQDNVEIKELSQTFIGSGQSVKFDFPQKVTPVVYVSFDSKKTVGKTTTIVELLKEKSSLVSELPSDEIYEHLNIWVGNSGFATPENIENSVVGFKVEKSWVEDKNIDQSSIALNRYNDNKWEQLQTSLSGEDDSYLYFTVKTQGFSEFAITGKTKAEETVTELQPETNINETETESQLKTDIKEPVTDLQNKTDVKDIGQNKIASDVKQANEQKGKTSTPGFEIVYGIIGLLGVFLGRRR